MSPVRRDAFKLARAFNILDVDGMARRMPLGRFIDWMAYDQIDPIDAGKRADFNAAAIIAMLVNMFQGWKGRESPFGAFDFMPQWGIVVETKSDPEPVEVYEKVKTWALWFKGVDNERDS